MIFDLLPEIFEQVFSYCNISDKKNLACTCSAYNEELKQVVWETVRIKGGHASLAKVM